MPGRPFAVGGPSQKTKGGASRRAACRASNVPSAFHSSSTSSSAAEGCVASPACRGSNRLAGVVRALMRRSVLPRLRADFPGDAIGERERAATVQAGDLDLAILLDRAQERVELRLQRALRAAE